MSEHERHVQPNKHGLSSRREYESLLLQHVSDAAWLTTLDGRYLVVNDSYSRYTSFDLADIGKSYEEIHPLELAQKNKEEDNIVITSGKNLRFDRNVVVEGGTRTIWLEIIKTPVFDDTGKMVAIAGIGRDITEKKRWEQQIARKNELLSAVQKTSAKLMECRDADEILPEILRRAAEIVRAPGGVIYLYDENQDVIKFKFLYGSLTSPPNKHLRRGQGLVGLVWQTKECRCIEDYASWEQRLEDKYWNRIKAAAAAPFLVDGQVVGAFAVYFFDKEARFSEDDLAALEQFASLASVALQNAQLFKKFKEELDQRIEMDRELRESEERYKALIQQSSDAIVLSDPDTDRILEANSQFFFLSGYHKEDLNYLTSQDLAENESRDLVSHYIDVVKYNEYLPPSVRVLKRKDSKTMRVERTSSLVTYGDKKLIMTNLRDVTERRHNRFLTLLQQTTLDIVRHLNKDQLLKEIVIRAAQLVGAQAGCCSLVMDKKLIFKQEYCLNLPDKLFQELDTVLGLSAKVFAAGEPVVVEHCAITEGRILDPVFDSAGAVAVIPLKDAKGGVAGMLCLIHLDKAKRFDEDEVYYLQQFAHLASLTLDKAYLYEEIKRQLIELQEAQASIEKAYDDLDRTYDTTLEGWAKALDLRDQETEGHSRRVSTLTINLARSMNVPEEQLIHYWRGCLLHDIGKLGVPDSILLKPGKLTEEEWKVMKQHTVWAYDWLMPIDYLQSCINIPHYHHERWDGTGYPRGLEGQQIPLEARIFAVADVWDALTSDRPYRKKWSEQQAREYIRANAGTHFDPRVIEAFLKLPAEAFQL